jgi:hypothetical protein
MHISYLYVYTTGAWSFPGGKAAGACLTTNPHLEPWLRKEWVYISTPLLSVVASSKMKFGVTERLTGRGR